MDAISASPQVVFGRLSGACHYPCEEFRRPLGAAMAPTRLRDVDLTDRDMGHRR
jgi:hypothetical protein